MAAKSAFNFGPLLAILLLMGIALVLRGRRRRVGSTPHCRRCDYILIGAEGRCPECGLELSAANVMYGERRGGVPFKAIAAVLLLVVGGWLAVTLPRMDWYHLRPTSWVLHDVESSDPNLNGRAWAELERRLAAGSLSAENDAKLMGLCMAELSGTGAWRPSRDGMLNLLADRAARHQLSAEQERRFVGFVAHVTLTTLRRVRPGQTPWVGIELGGRGPNGSEVAWWYSLADGKYFLDGRPIDGPTAGLQGSWQTGGSAESSHGLPRQTPGRHEITADVSLDVSCNGVFRARVTRHLATSFEVLTADPPVATLPSPGLTDQIRAAASAKARWSQGNRVPQLNLELNVNRPPCTFAAEVWVAVDGAKPWRLSTLHASKGEQCTHEFGTTSMPTTPAAPTKIDVILRGTAAAATDKGLTSNWFGEIVFRDVPIGGAAATAPAAAGK